MSAELDSREAGVTNSPDGEAPDQQMDIELAPATHPREPGARPAPLSRLLFP